MASYKDLHNRVFKKIQKIQREVKRKRLALPIEKYSVYDYPTIVVACGYIKKKKIFVERSGKPINVTWVHDIELRLSALKRCPLCDNPIGACAEPKAANKVKNKFPKCKMNELQFSDPYRPRTCKRKKYCENCKYTFSEVL